MTGFFALLYDAHLEAESSCCLSLCWEPGSCPGVLFSTHMGLHVGACGLRPAQAYILALAWVGSLEGVGSFIIRRAVGLAGSAVHLFPKTSWFCPILGSLYFLQHWFYRCCALKFLCVHLLIRTSYFVPKWHALKIISHTPCPGRMQQSPYIPKRWFFIEVHHSWNLFPSNLPFPAWTFQ